MSLPIRHLDVIQNWDCHVCGTCCKEYQITVTEEERKRIEAQGWEKDPEFRKVPLFTKHGRWWNRSYRLNHRQDGSCVFLSDKGRCRIHEKFGYETKPLACRLFPFVLIPVSDHWRVGLRFACPSAARNLGRHISAHDEDLKKFARMLAARENLEVGPDGFQLPPPVLQGSQRVQWPELLSLVQALLDIIRNRRDRLERRLRKCLALAQLARQANLEKLQGPRLAELLNILTSSLDGEVSKDTGSIAPPSWVGRMLFRQVVALYSRKDQGPNRGRAAGSRLRLLAAALRFARGTGAVPRLHNWIPETTFEAIESTVGAPSDDVDEILERYYTVKIGSLQFCGPAFFGLPFWEGLEALLITFPVILWVARAFPSDTRADAVIKALSIVDDHYGFNRMLQTSRQRLSFRILARWGELEKLIAWYSR